MDLWIDFYTRKLGRIAQRTIKLSGKNRREIDRLGGAVIELDAKGKGPICSNDATR